MTSNRPITTIIAVNWPIMSHINVAELTLMKFNLSQVLILRLKKMRKRSKFNKFRAMIQLNLEMSPSYHLIMRLHNRLTSNLISKWKIQLMLLNQLKLAIIILIITAAILLIKLKKFSHLVIIWKKKTIKCKMKKRLLSKIWT